MTCPGRTARPTVTNKRATQTSPSAPSPAPTHTPRQRQARPNKGTRAGRENADTEGEAWHCASAQHRAAAPSSPKDKAAATTAPAKQTRHAAPLHNAGTPAEDTNTSAEKYSHETQSASSASPDDPPSPTTIHSADASSPTQDSTQTTPTQDAASANTATTDTPHKHNPEAGTTEPKTPDR